jgi:hypothetical protein
MSIFNELVTVAEMGEAVGTGWLPPLPDLRDYTESTPVNFRTFLEASCGP